MSITICISFINQSLVTFVSSTDILFLGREWPCWSVQLRLLADPHLAGSARGRRLRRHLLPPPHLPQPEFRLSKVSYKIACISVFRQTQTFMDEASFTPKESNKYRMNKPQSDSFIECWLASLSRSLEDGKISLLLIRQSVNLGLPHK